jgi:peptidoglycan biosynthesis protein MviN/MurJ (putative lipid II flippase)
VLAQVYFARQNPGKPLIVGMTSIAVAAIAGTMLAPGMAATGAALAASLAFWTQSLLLAALLAHQRLWTPGLALLRAVVAVLAAAVLMAAAIIWLGGEMHGMLVGHIAGIREFALLIGLCTAGSIVYAASVVAFGVLRSDLLASASRKARIADANI